MLFTCGHVTEQTRNIESGYLILFSQLVYVRVVTQCGMGSLVDKNWNFSMYLLVEICPLAISAFVLQS